MLRLKFNHASKWGPWWSSAGVHWSMKLDASASEREAVNDKYHVRFSISKIVNTESANTIRNLQHRHLCHGDMTNN